MPALAGCPQNPYEAFAASWVDLMEQALLEDFSNRLMAGKTATARPFAKRTVRIVGRRKSWIGPAKNWRIKLGGIAGGYGLEDF